MHESITDLPAFLAKHTRIVILFVSAEPDVQYSATASKSFEELEGSYPDIEFVKLCITDNKESTKLFAKYGEGKVPFIAALKDGKKVDYAMSMNKIRLEALFDSLMKRG